MRTIASRAGVTQPLIHHYFGSKEALFDAVFEASIENYNEVQFDQWNLPAGDLRFLTKGLVVLFRWLGAHPELMRLVTWARLEGKTEVGRHASEVFLRVRERLEHAQDAGLLRADIDLDIAQLMVDSVFKGYWDRRATYGAYPLIDTDALDDRFQEHAIRMLLVGLLVPDAAEEALKLLRADEMPGVQFHKKA